MTNDAVQVPVRTAIFAIGIYFEKIGVSFVVKIREERKNQKKLKTKLVG